MADRPAHLRKAAHNTKFADLVEKFDPRKNPKYPDWLVTIAFYTALQYVDAKLAKMNMHPDDHHERDRLVAAQLKDISDEYQFLKGKSEFARYFPDSEKKISPALVEKCLQMAAIKFL